MNSLDIAPYDAESPSYTDIAGLPQEGMIEAAVARCILTPVEGEAFKPQDLATREFAAMTAVRALGFAEVDDRLTCADATLLHYPSEAFLAVDLGLMTLLGQAFCPSLGLSHADADQILLKVKEINDSTNFTGNGGKGFTFLESAIVLDADTVHSIEGGKLVLNASVVPQTLKKDDIIVIGTTEAYKVANVSRNGDLLSITYTEPELEDFLSAIDIYGEAEADFMGFMPEDDVVIESITPIIRTVAQAPANAKASDSDDDLPFSVEIKPGIGKDEVGGITVKGKKKLANGFSLNFKFDLNIGKVLYKYDIAFHPLSGIFGDDKIVDIKNAYVKIEFDTKVSGGISVEGKDKFLEETYKIGTIPIIGADGFGINIDVCLKLKAKGELALTLNWNGMVGAQIYQNRPRIINDIDSTLSMDISGEITLAPAVDVNAEVFDKRVISFAIEAGGKGHIDFLKWHIAEGIVCIDGYVGIYAKISAFKHTVIEDWLKVSGEWEMNHKVMEGHWENLHHVDECTFTKDAIIKGAVAKANDRTKYIAGAKIKAVKDPHEDHEETTTSDRNGEFTLEVPEGTYNIRVSATGYIPFEVRVNATVTEDTYVEALLMVEGEEGTTVRGTIGGKITNSLTGAGIDNVKLTIRKGWNITSGSVVTTTTSDSSGSYNVNLPLGNYTILMEKNGFVSSHFNVVVTRQSNMNWNGALLPTNASNNTLRVVLTWGETPADLDSHMRGPVSGFHTYYDDRVFAQNGVKLGDLDVDDTNSYGPETTTVYDLSTGGTYRYYVHDFTNRAKSDSIAMSNSGAKVTVYRGATLLATYAIPTSKVGTVWYVFDYNADTQQLTSHNTFSNESNASNVGTEIRTVMLRSVPSPDKE